MSTKQDNSQSNQDILDDIQSLQQLEQDLFNSLETNTTLTSDQQTNIVERMNQLSIMRINLYKTLEGLNNTYQNSLSSSVETLQDQTSAIKVVEEELNNSKKRLEFLEAKKNNKIRLVEINDYYADKYSEHSTLMKIVTFTLIPIVILLFMHANPVLAVLSLFVAYVLITNSSLVTGTDALRRFLPSEEKKNCEMSAYNFTPYHQFPYTLEQEVVKKMAPLNEGGSVIHANFKPLLVNDHDAAHVNFTNS
jgi:hypothetical protein